MDLEPDFEKRVLEGSVYVKGRLRTVHMEYLQQRCCWIRISAALTMISGSLNGKAFDRK